MLRPYGVSASPKSSSHRNRPAGHRGACRPSVDGFVAEAGACGLIRPYLTWVMTLPTNIFRYREAIFIVLVSIALVGLLQFLLNEVFGRSCRSGLVAEFPSPSHILKASVSVRRCGATGEVATLVSLLDADQAAPVDSANVLTVQASGGKSSGWSLGGPEVSVTWEAETLLAVRYDSTDRVLRSAARVHGVLIKYSRLRYQTQF